MSFGALSAVGAVVQIAKTLYEYYNIHRNNKALLDILEGFTQNLEIGVERLKAREEMLALGQNDALDSIERDFTNAKNWLLSNDKNLRSIWTALQASDKLKDLDQRLTKAFASKMSIAIFSALQDTRSGVIKIQTTLEGLPTNLETVCRTSTKEAIHQAIDELKKEAYEAVGGGEGPKKGFRNGEAEKIISQLVDQLAEQERIKEDEELLSTVDYPPLLPSRPSSSPPVPYTAASSSIPAVPYTPATSRRLSRIPVSANEDDPFEPTPSALDPFEPAPSIRTNHTLSTSGDESSLFSRKLSARTAATSELSDRSSVAKEKDKDKVKGKERKDRIPTGAIVFNPKDPFSESDLIDPVLANDGLIHDRWTLVEGSHENVRDPADPLLIVGDLVQLREAIFKSFPERRVEMQAKRQAYREETIQLYDSSDYTSLSTVINRLSHVLLFEPTSVSIRVRRGIARYRLRDLSAALEDLDRAVELSTRDAAGTPNRHEPDVDALRARALVKEEMHDNDSALADLEAILSQSPHDVLALGLRAMLRGSAGDLVGAQADLAATNQAVRSGKAYRSRLGDADCDLEYLARGWAYTSVRDFSSAVADFSFSLSLRDPPEPYTLACRGLARLKQAEASGELTSAMAEQGIADLDASIEMLRKLAVAQQKTSDALQRYTSGASMLQVGPDGLPTAAFSCLLLRASARQSQGEYELALSDFETGLRLRPAAVKDVGALRCALAEIRVECGDRDGAQRDFDIAVAIGDPGQRFAFISTREEYGL
ncbi:hypothetical protein JCM5296_006507 [Sporobolomyces johnsonii]